MDEPWGSPRPDREDRELDREVPTARRPVDTASSWDREDRESDREGIVVDDREPVEDREALGFLSPLQELRFVRELPGTVGDHIDYAIHGAYSMPNTFWRTAHILYAYLVVSPGILLCRAIEWAFFQRLSRALIAIPVLVATMWLLNRIPVVQLLVPDQWDITSWFVPEAPAPGEVEVPIDPSMGVD